MGIKTLYSSKENIDSIISDIRDQSKGLEAKMVIFFASSRFDPERLSHEMQQVFGAAPVFGCSSAGEIVSGKMLKGSVVAMVLGPDIIEDLRVEVVEDVRSENRVPEVFRHFEDYYNISMSETDFSRHIGIVLIDGLSLSEEKLMEKIGDLTDVTFIGASAGDDLQFKRTYVYAGGKAYTDAAVLALVRPAVEFGILKTQSFCALDKKLKATRVDEAARKVLEFNNRPAAEAYAEALGIPAEDAANHFMDNPVGLMFGDEPYVRSPRQIQDKAMVFYCKVKQGMELKVLESGDIVEDTEKALEQKKAEMGNISGIINFHCILRTLQLEQKGQTGEYGKLFSDIPTIGFSTYGEEYIGHINQTSTMLIFK